MFSYPFPYGTKLFDFLSPHSPVLLLKKTNSSVSIKINKARSLQPAIVWILGWQVACMWGKEGTQSSSPCSQKSCKNNLEMFVSALFGWNQMISEAEAKSAAHAFFTTLIHTLNHVVLRENRCGKQSIIFTTGDKVLYKSHKSNPCWQVRYVHTQSTWAQAALTVGVKTAKPPASSWVQGKVNSYGFRNADGTQAQIKVGWYQHPCDCKHTTAALASKTTWLLPKICFSDFLLNKTA